MENEIWKSVVGYEGLYEVSNFDKVRSLDQTDEVFNGRVFCNKFRKGRILRIQPDNYGYLMIGLSLKKVRKNAWIHRLVAKAFIANPENKPQVNHINGIKTDNRVENLEWNTAKENTQHAFSTGLAKAKRGADNKKSKPISQFDLSGNWVRDWASAKDVFIELGFDNSNILKTIKGKFSHAYGFTWKFTKLL